MIRMTAMKNFFIITNLAKDPDRSITDSIVRYIENRGGRAAVHIDSAAPEDGRRSTEPDDIPEDTDGIIVLGGDGTLIRAADDVVDRQIPLLGVNLGTLGYLTEIDRNSIFPALDALLEGRYQIESRMMLRGRVYHEGKVISEESALNDIVIGRENSMHVISITNYVNDAFLNSYRADGMIISTPTGSTGYSLSVGGPLISPEAHLFLMTPIAAHTLNTRSIILPEENRITVRLGPGRDNTIEHAMAYFDGDRKAPMVTGNSVVIVRADRDVKITKIHNDSFLGTLRRKMSNI